ncbi:hypothetical protein C8R43DRAFT_977627 [Mycena crocata]|nr:hypothetical protein C8R43DRAFT_977627 [Mycena crocata]
MRSLKRLGYKCNRHAANSLSPPMTMSRTMTSIGLFFLLVSFCAAQATTIPQCALGCARESATDVECDISDTPCLCRTSFMIELLKCVGTTSCSATDQTQTSSIIERMCAAVSVSASGSLPASSGSTPLTPSAPISLSMTTVTSTITSLSPPTTVTTTFTTALPLSSTSVPSGILPPPISLPSSLSLSRSSLSFSPSATAPGASTSPSPSQLGAADRYKMDVLRLVAAVTVVGVGMWV